MNFQTLLYVLLIIAAIVLFVSWSNSQDEKRMEAITAYEECVLFQYGTTPTAWLDANGEYPPCS